MFNFYESNNYGKFYKLPIYLMTCYIMPSISKISHPLILTQSEEYLQIISTSISILVEVFNSYNKLKNHRFKGG